MNTIFNQSARVFVIAVFFKCYSIQRGFRDKVISYFLALCINNDEFNRGNAPYLLSSIQFIVLSQHKNFVLPRHLINLLPSRIFQFSFSTLFSYFSNFLAVIPISFGQCCIRLTSQFLVAVLPVLSNMSDMLSFHFTRNKLPFIILYVG